ncbi:MAG TPA: nuclear transport factor 2 family protein [Steroidobacteraceae bacterium]|nr:nuclear transport factor 2 family protein [Steroidobacteraceae bacterium]
MDRRHFLEVSTTVTAGLFAATAGAATDPVSEPLQVLREVILAWRRKDLDAMLQHIDDDIAWHSHVGSPPLQGKVAMREFATRLTAQMQEIRWRLFEAARDGDRLHVEGVDDFVSNDGRRVVVPYAGVMRFRDGRIVEWRDYFDRALFERLKAGEPLPAYLEGLANRPALF